MGERRYEKPMIIKRSRRLSRWLRFRGILAIKDHLTRVSMQEYWDEIKPVVGWRRKSCQR